MKLTSECKNYTNVMKFANFILRVDFGKTDTVIDWRHRFILFNCSLQIASLATSSLGAYNNYSRLRLITLTHSLGF